MDLYHSYAPQVSRNMMNSLSTHDTPRFLTRCHNNQDLQKLAATVQFTWPGMPCIYYGEEIGMQGAADPDNRRCMEWQQATPDNSMLRYYKRLIHLRKTSRVLQSGVPSILMTDDTASTFAYSRTLGVDVAIVAVNKSGKARTLSIPLAKAAGHSFVDALSGRRYATRVDGTVNMKLGPLQAAILFPK